MSLMRLNKFLKARDIQMPQRTARDKARKNNFPGAVRIGAQHWVDTEKYDAAMNEIDSASDHDVNNTDVHSIARKILADF